MDAWREIIVDGLTEYGVRYNDIEASKVGGTLASVMDDVVSSHIRGDDACRLAFPTIVVRPEVRANGLVAIMADRAILFWTRGVFRTRSSAEVIPLENITEVSTGSGTDAGTRQARLMTIQHTHGKSQFALPKDGSAFIAADIEAALRPTHPGDATEGDFNDLKQDSGINELPEAQVPGTSREVSPAAWHPDPWHQARLRYWNGFEWTGHTSD